MATVRNSGAVDIVVKVTELAVNLGKNYFPLVSFRSHHRRRNYPSGLLIDSFG
jgi:hypothetical protein